MKRGQAQVDFSPPPDDMVASDYDSDTSWEDVGASDSPPSQRYARKSTGGIWVPTPHDTEAQDFEDGFDPSHTSTPLVVKEYEMYPPQPTAADTKVQDHGSLKLDDGSAPEDIKGGGSAAEKSVEESSDTTTSTIADSTKPTTDRPEKIPFTVMQKVCAFVLLFLAAQIDLDVFGQYHRASSMPIQFLMTMVGVLCLSGAIFVPMFTLIDWLDSPAGKEEGDDSGPLLHILTKSLVTAFTCGAVTPRLFPNNFFLGVSDWQKNQPPSSWWMQAHDLGLLFSLRAFALVMVFGILVLMSKVFDAYIEDDEDVVRTDEQEKVLADVRDELRGYGEKISNFASNIWNSGILSLICKHLLAYLVLYAAFASLRQWTAFERAYQQQGFTVKSLKTFPESLNATQGLFTVPTIDCKAHPEGLPCELVSSLASPGRVDCEKTHKDLKFNCVGASGWLRKNGAPDLVLENREHSCGKMMIPCPPAEEGGCMGQIDPSIAFEPLSIVPKTPNAPGSWMYDIQQPCVRHGGDTFPGSTVQEPQSKSGAENPSQPEKAYDSQPQEDSLPGVIDCNEYPEGLPCELVSKWARPGAVECSLLPEGLKFPCMKTAKWLFDDLYHRSEQAWGCKLISNGRGGWTSER